MTPGPRGGGESTGARVSGLTLHPNLGGETVFDGQHRMVTADDHTLAGSLNPGLSRVVALGSPNALGRCARIKIWAGGRASGGERKGCWGENWRTGWAVWALKPHRPVFKCQPCHLLAA